MDIKKTSLERAFDLAASGECQSVEYIMRRLDKEGYSSSQIEGPVLRQQLLDLMAEARSKHQKSP